MVARSTPASRKRKLSVPSTSSKGKPAANPKPSMRSAAAERYTRQASAQLRPPVCAGLVEAG